MFKSTVDRERGVFLRGRIIYREGRRYEVLKLFLREVGFFFIGYFYWFRFILFRRWED